MIKLNAKVPDNMVFLQGDALQSPFRLNSFNTVISLNLLHVLDDVHKALAGINKVLAERGIMSFTTLISNNRRADKYLEKMLKKASGVSPRL
jgi:ubiquinone/menaquinone biosynthesis C-methylase UbiE